MSHNRRTTDFSAAHLIRRKIEMRSRFQPMFFLYSELRLLAGQFLFKCE